MVLKRLAELPTNELMSEFGNQGEFCKSLAIVKLTIFLVSSGKELFTFLFDIMD